MMFRNTHNGNSGGPYIFVSNRRKTNEKVKETAVAAGFFWEFVKLGSSKP